MPDLQCFSFLLIRTFDKEGSIHQPFMISLRSNDDLYAYGL